SDVCSSDLLAGDEKALQVINLDASLEELVASSLIQTEQGVQLVMDPQQAHEFIMKIADTIEAHPEIAAQPVLLTSPTIRRHVFKLTHRFLDRKSVVSHNELSSDVSVQSLGVVELAHAS